MQPNPKILLSFDVEEFDLPLEYGQAISQEEQLATGYRGLEQIGGLLQLPGVCTTLFTTAFFAAHYPEAIKALGSRHEIASHTYYHSSFAVEDLQQSKNKLEEIAGKKVTGLRMPRMKPVHPSLVAAAGYGYNSSFNPTWIPGRYNNLHLPRMPFRKDALVQFPVSVTPHLRIPLFWLAFKNMPYITFLKLALQTMRYDGHISLYFHPWEFVDLSGYRLPPYTRRGSKGTLLVKLQRLLRHLSAEGEFCTMHEFITRNL
ncbi:MAG: DUF3473 domain-containing protein [Williamsia sp.]|nr:DUF3473 domain-containing protein [Williamsia sp.]